MSAEGQPLTALPAGSKGVVVSIKVAPEHRGRLLEMGLLIGTAVEVVRYAPLGVPVELKVRGYNLTLRKHDADQIWIHQR